MKRAVTQGLIFLTFLNIFTNALLSTYCFIICNNFKYINIPMIKLSGQATIIFFTSTRFYFYNIHIKDILGNSNDFHQSNVVL